MVLIVAGKQLPATATGVNLASRLADQVPTDMLQSVDKLLSLPPVDYRPDG